MSLNSDGLWRHAFLGTFFYVAFNVLSGAAAIPKEMNEAADVLGLRGHTYLKRVFVPAILPSLVTGCVTAWGGGWNAIIFSEYVVAAGGAGWRP